MFRFVQLFAAVVSLFAARLGLCQSTITLPIDYWDFLYNGTAAGTYGGYPGVGHPDFNDFGCGVTTGLVQSTLGSNGLPVFGPNGTSCITSAASFAQWYQTTPGVNVYAPGTLTLTNIGNNTYQYSQSPDFFPLDGQGFNSGGSQGDLACDGSGPHNFSFTTHIQFTAQFATNSQSITVTGDDDIWVFINGHLIIDLGGVHGASTGSFTGTAPSLAELGISLGQTVSVDIFQAQRHTCGSDFTLTTSMANITPTLEPSVNIANTNSQITITFLGILQQSPDLVSWQNVNPQPSSPWSFSPSSGEFFRARR